MVLQQIFSEKNIILNLTSEDKDELFEEMIQNIVDNNPAVNRAEALDALLDREKKMSTGILPQIAVPHCVLNGINGVYGALGISKKGINFDSLDGNPVNYVFMFIFGEDSSEIHLKALKELAEILQKRNFLPEMAKVKSCADVLELLKL